MKKLLTLLARFLLLVNGVGALYGGWNLIAHPDGSTLQLSLHWLRHSPFTNYLIPGIILFTANGLFSMFVFVALVVNMRNYARLVIAQGVILTGWILVQLIMIQTIHFLHVILGTIGIILIFIGKKLSKHSN